MNTKYVLASYWKDKKVYYVETVKETLYGLPIRKLSETIDGATLYNSIDEVENDINSINDSLFKIYPVCPICNEDYDGHPAISRKDNISEICPNCGIGEAFMDFIEHQKKATI